MARFNSELGQLAWSTYFGDNNANFNEINALAKNPVTSALMVTGNAGTGSNFPLLDIGSGFFESSGLAFLSEFNIEEKIIWSSRFGSTSCDIFDIKYDSKGNLFLTGVDKDLTSSSDDLPIIGSGTTYTQSHTNETLNDAIIAKIDTDRELVWSTFFGDLGSDSGRSLAISNDDKVFLLGQVQGGFSAFPLLNYSSSSYFDDIRNDNDMFIARFSNKGEQEWTSYFGGSQNDFASKLVYDEDNDLIIVAGITQSTDISSSFFSSSLYQQDDLNTNGQDDSLDGVLVTFDSDLAQGWTTYFGGYGDLAQSGNDINDRIFSATITDGSLFIVGSSGAYSPKLPVQDPGGGAYYQPELSGDIGVDGFIAKLDLDGNSITNLKDEELIGNQIKVFPNPFKESIEVIVMNESHF